MTLAVTHGNWIPLSPPTSNKTPTLQAVQQSIIVLIEPAIVPVLDLNIPIHISQLAFGDQVRISLGGSYSYVSKITPQGKHLLVSKDKRRVTRGYEITTMVGSIISNRPNIGEMDLNVIVSPQKTVYRATVLYKHISIIQRVVPSTPIESATPSHPGSHALGTLLNSGRLLTSMYNLVRVKF